MLSKKLHPLVEKISNFLKLKNIEHRLEIHEEEAKTSEDACRIRGDCSLSEGVKALILRCKKTKKGDKFFVQVCVSGDKRFNIKKLKEILKVSDIRFASESELIEITDGVLPGGVPPVSSVFFNIPLYADEKIFLNNRVVFNCGDRKASIYMSSPDYKKVFIPQTVDITGE